MQEWSKQNEFNSFSSVKGYTYIAWYEAIKEWKEGKRLAPLPPVEASLDPIHACNLQCAFCNAASYLRDDIKNRKMSDEHLVNLIRFLGEWGVKAVCVGGGGEPTMHPKFADALYECRNSGMGVAVATNGTLFNDSMIDSMAKNCRWVGVSVDASTKETYKLERKLDCFDRALNNIAKLTDKCRTTSSKCDVGFKFLVFQKNQHEIYDACKIAKSLGVHDFHARVASFTHQGMGENKLKTNPYNRELILSQFEKCHTLEDENFKVITAVHKVEDDFSHRKDFDQCYASPCCIQLCADNFTYLCPDTRHMEFYRLGSHYPDPSEIKKFWGSQKHYDLVFKNGKANCSWRCTYCTFNKQCQELTIKENDPLCRFFI